MAGPVWMTSQLVLALKYRWYCYLSNEFLEEDIRTPHDSLHLVEEMY